MDEEQADSLASSNMGMNNKNINHGDMQPVMETQ